MLLHTPDDTGKFERYLLDRVGDGTVDTYKRGVRALIRAGGSPGWGPEETAAARAARHERFLGLSYGTKANYAAGWAHWRAYVLAEHGEVVPVLFTTADPPELPVDVGFAVLALYEALSEPELIRLTWSDVNIEQGLIAKSAGSTEVHARAMRYGTTRIRAALQRLVAHFNPVDNGERVLPGDRVNRYQPFPARTLRTLLGEVRRLRATGQHTPIGGTAVIGAAQLGVRPPQAVPRAPQVSADFQALRADWGDLTPPGTSPEPAPALRLVPPSESPDLAADGVALRRKYNLRGELGPRNEHVSREEAATHGLEPEDLQRFPTAAELDLIYAAG